MSDLECAVLEAVADSLLLREPGTRVALSDSTKSGPSSLEGVRRDLQGIVGVDSSTVANFVAVSRRRVATCRRFPAGTPLVIVTDGAFASLPGVFDEHWRAFLNAFPQTRGIASVSSIGFSDDQRQALLSLTYLCGRLCGYGSLVLVERGADGRWRVRTSRILAVS